MPAPIPKWYRSTSRSVHAKVPGANRRPTKPEMSTTIPTHLHGERTVAWPV
jgi:hypothetical protein